MTDFPTPLPLDPPLESPIAEVTPEPLIPPLDVYPDVLAYTGGDGFLIAAVMFALFCLGAAFIAARRLAAPAPLVDPVTGLAPADAAPRYRRRGEHTRSVPPVTGFTP